MLRAELSELAREDTELEKNAAERRAQVEMDVLQKGNDHFAQVFASWKSEKRVGGGPSKRGGGAREYGTRMQDKARGV